MTARASTISPAVIGALDAAWARIRELHPDVPEVVITIAGGSSMAHGRGGGLRGHFWAGRWERTSGGDLPELFIAGERLADGATGVLETMLHEAAHGIADTRGIRDTSDQGRHHNKRFAAIAREIGLDVTYDGSRRGWTDTTLHASAKPGYDTVLRQLAEAITASRRTDPPGGRRARASSNNPVPAVCGCVPVRRIRVAPSVLALGPVTCGVCGDDFTEDGGQ